MALSAVGRWASKLGALGARRPWPLKDFSNPNFERIDAGQLIEEERLPDYLSARYYPVRIGQLLASRYQVVGKLGFGVTSTVWLARDLPDRRYVALKVFIRSASFRSQDLGRELAAYRRLSCGPKTHIGREAVRTLLDSFTVTGPDGEHQCLVHRPLWESMVMFQGRNPVGRLPAVVLAVMLRQVLLALDYMRECRVIHTDVKGSNIMFGVSNDAIFQQFEQAEIDQPSPRKEADGRLIYATRSLDMPDIADLAAPVLCDLGAAEWGDEPHDHDVQPEVYRSPEVLVGAPWGYEIDVWSVACVIWDLYEGGHLFTGDDPEHGEYRTRAHLAELIALLGPPPQNMLVGSRLGSKLFSADGKFIADVPIPPPVSLEDLETTIDDVADKQLFLKFMSKMLQWDPRDRHTPAQLLDDEWLKKHTEC